MLCNRKKSSPCLFLLVALLGAILAGCGGDEPAPAPPPPPPPPPPAFVPVDVSIELGTSGETLTLQTTESGGFTRNGEAFASGTTVEAAGNNYRLVLEDGEWAAQYVAPRPWATALGRSGDALLITRREDGLFEVGEGDDKTVFSSGGTLTASNGNEYRLTLSADTNAWQVEYLPPEPAAVLLGMSGETVLVERLEGGGYSVGGQRVVAGSTVQSASGSTYRLAMQDGVWSATFVPPPPVSVPLGRSGETVTLQIGEDGNFYKGDQLYSSGSEEPTEDGTIYRLTLQNGMWSATALSTPVVVTLGASGATVTLQRVTTADGFRYEKDGQLFETGSMESAGGNTYRLVLQDGVWSAEYVPRTVVVALGTSGETIILLQVTEDGSRYETQDGRPYVSGTTETAADGTRFEVVLRNGVWGATPSRPDRITVRLGERGGTITLLRYSNGDLTYNGEPFTSGRTITSPDNDSVYIVDVEQRDDGTWGGEGRFRPQPLRVTGADGQLLLFRHEDGTYTDTEGNTVRDGTRITYKGVRYELVALSDGWLADPIGSVAPAGDQVVELPNSDLTITLTRNDNDQFEHDGRVVRNGDERTVGGVRYRLTQASDGRWSAAAVRDTTTTDTGGIGGPTTTDTVDDFTDGRFDDDLTTDPDLNTYGVKFTTRGEQPINADDRGTKIVPQRSGASHVEFPVYDLMQQGLNTRERTYVEVAKAKLQEIVDIITLNKDLYARDARDPDDHIADDASTTAASGTGLWRLAEMAVGKIFGLTAGNDMDGILGANPWSGLTLDVDEVDDVIEALEDTIAVLSDSGRFRREYEEQIADVNKGIDPGETATSDDLDHDAADFFNGLMSRIRFGSTSATRFGAYVVKEASEFVSTDRAATFGDASDAARGAWTKGVFAYTPSDEPRATDIPDRGEATYRGTTVAVSEVDPDNRKGATLYAGKIELVASFTRKSVKGTITELKDESGRTWVHDDGYGNEEVKSIVLPDAHRETAAETGFYEERTASDNATAIFADTSLPNATGDGSKFRVQLVEDAGEALGVWEAFGLEGAFGATRTGTVSKPTLPREVDRGGGAHADSLHYLTVVPGTAGTTGSGNPITADTEESTFSLTRTDLGISSSTDAISDEEFDRDFTNLELTDLYRRSRTGRSGSGFVSEARARISRLTSSLSDTNLPDRDTAATTILTSLLGSSIGGKDVDATDVSTFRRDISRLTSALGSATRLHRALTDADGYLTGLESWDLDQATQVYSEKRWDFKYDFGHNKYTRFGVWSQIAPEAVADNVDGSTTDDDSLPHVGSFAYSPLAPAAADDVSGLTFAATYEGRTLAVNESTGDLYAGQFILRVNWAPGTPDTSVRTTITDLRGVRGTSAYFKYNTKDVKSIFFTGLTADDGVLGGTPAMTVRYRDSSQDTTAAAGIAVTMSGEFVMDEEFMDEPVGVLGVWRITDSGATRTVDNYSASFGAELKP